MLSITIERNRLEISKQDLEDQNQRLTLDLVTLKNNYDDISEELGKVNHAKQKDCDQLNQQVSIPEDWH